MPVELNITESVTELDTTVVQVTLESASAPGPAGPQGAQGIQGIQGIQGEQGEQGDPGEGVPTGGTTGQVLAKASNTDFDTEWSSVAGGGAPTDADYLVGTANGSLSNEIVVGTSPGGELGGTWASPTVDATHSGSSHAAVQAAAEATAAGELATHAADTTSVHGIADTSALLDTADIGSTVQPNDSDLTAIAALTTTAFGRGLLELANQAALLAAAGAAAASHAHSGSDITSGTVADARIDSTIARDSEVTTAISNHEADTTSVHGIADTSTLYRSGGTDVALADGGTGASLADPNADRILFWDDSAGSVAFLTAGTNLTITGTTIDASGSGGSSGPDYVTAFLFAGA